jgi:hypothetical protein
MAPLEIRHRSVRPISAKHAQASRFLQQSRAAYAAAVQWTREGNWQSEDARFWDVLNVIRPTARQVAGDLIPRETYVLRVPNTTRSGNPSTATTASRQRLRVSIEGYNLTGQACIIIALPGED